MIFDDSTDAFIPYTDMEQTLAKLPTDKNAKILLYCRSGHMSGIAASALVKLGYTRACAPATLAGKPSEGKSLGRAQVPCWPNGTTFSEFACTL